MDPGVSLKRSLPVEEWKNVIHHLGNVLQSTAALKFVSHYFTDKSKIKCSQITYAEYSTDEAGCNSIRVAACNRPSLRKRLHPINCGKHHFLPNP